MRRFRAHRTVERRAASRAHTHDLDAEQRACHGVRTPHVEAVAAHRPEIGPALPDHRSAPISCATQSARRSRSRMIARTRVSTTAIVYIQKASAIKSIPVNIV